MHTNDLEKIFNENTGNLIHKWKHYFEIYDRHFQRFRNKKITILEIGIYKGGSLNMWQQYFGENCQIIGVDINPLCKRFESDRVKVYIGSQEDRNFLRNLKKQIPKVDILIDDGGHMMKHLRTTFEELYDWVDENGVYLAEDLHTSYWPQYDGGYKRRGSFIEYCKDLIDQLNAWHSQTRQLKVDDFTKSTHSIHFYDSIVVFEKRILTKPVSLYSGQMNDEDIESESPQIKKPWRWLKYHLYKHLGIDLN